MKTIIKSIKRPPLRRVLCSFLFGAAAFCIVPANIQAGDIVWVTAGNTIAEYNADGTAINTNFLTEQPIRLWGQELYGIPHLGGILASASGGPTPPVPTLNVACEWVPNLPFSRLQPYWRSWYITYVITLYDAVTGSVISGTNRHVFQPSPLNGWKASPLGPAGMALSRATLNLYVANYSGNSITKGGNLSFITSTSSGGVTNAPYALTVNGSVLYVTNNAQNFNGNFYISAYDANGGGLLNANLIETPPVGLYGLARQGNILYVSVYSGIASGVWTYDVSNPTKAQPIKGPLVSVNEPWGIAIEGKTLYVASNQDSMIYEYNATTGAKLRDSIKVNSPTNISVYPATQP
jgi:hypothetical protein